jgi:hypothetical protein
MIKIGKMCCVGDVAVLHWIRDAEKNAVPLNPKSDSGILLMVKRISYGYGVL